MTISPKYLYFKTRCITSIKMEALCYTLLENLKEKLTEC